MTDEPGTPPPIAANKQNEDEIKESKPIVATKSSMEILSELFSTFDAKPPVIVKKESDASRKHKKSGKKRRQGEKKHTKAKKLKKKKKKHRDDSDSSSSDDQGIDLSDLLIKAENEGSLSLTDTLEKIINIKTDSMNQIKRELEMEMKQESIDAVKQEPKEAKSKYCDESKDESRKRKKHKSEKHIEETCSKRSQRRLSKETDKSRKFHREEDERSHRSGRSWRNSYERDRSRSPRYRDKYDRSERSRMNEDRRKHNSRETNYNEEKRFRDRYNERERSSRTSDAQSNSAIDKKKLLEIARRNAIHMVKIGSMPSSLGLGSQAPEKVIAAIRCGGKTVEELTDFCKTLSNKEDLDDISNVSSESDSDGELKLHHPFLVKEKSLVMNIKNSVPLPTKTNQERASELRLQFPVSSGQQHRRTEREWVPVSPKKTDVPVKAQLHQQTACVPSTLVTPTNALQMVPAATTNAPPGPQMFPVVAPHTVNDQNLDAIISHHLATARKMQENANEQEIANSVDVWAESKQPIGQFTGSTGAQVLSPAELAGGQQAWARKDQLQTAAPLSGGMGMHMLQKMGWRPGEGLGKEKTGALEPLLLEVKLDKKGIVAREEGKRKVPIAKVTKHTVMTLQGKHPVSLLGEYASKKKLGVPEYLLDFECGPDHMKNFLFKVLLNGVEYKPNIASGNKKEAKAVAATICLQALGLLP